jgi:hypothetical protein
MRTPLSVRLLVVGLFLAIAGRAAAQATRTWVSGVGDDANPCSRTAPCRTFAGAISKTAAGGAIGVLDPGEFGQITITKAVTLDGRTTLGGVLAAGSSGIVVNAPGAVVVLRNLDLTGTASATHGVSFVAGAELHVEGCTIAGFAQNGIDFAPVAGGRLHVAGLEARANGNAGILLASADATRPSIATVARAQLAGNGSGLLAKDHARASVYGAVVSGSAGAGVAALPDAAGDAELNLEGVVLSGNALGLQASAPLGSALVRLSKVVALDNGTSTEVGANGRLLSFGNNRIAGVAPGVCSVRGNAVIPASLPSGAVGEPYLAAVDMSNSLGPVASFLSGPLPAGLTFSDGTISGTPTAAGSYPVSVEVHDANGCAASLDYLLAIAPDPDFSLSASPAGPSVRAGESATLSVTVTPVGVFAAPVALSCENLPRGVTCSFSPASLTPAGGPVTGTLTLSTTAAKAAGALTEETSGKLPRPLWSLAMPALLLAAGAAAWRRGAFRSLAAPLRAAPLVALAILGSCHSDSKPASTAPGTYALWIAGTSASPPLAHGVDVTLTVSR